MKKMTTLQELKDTAIKIDKEMAVGFKFCSPGIIKPDVNPVFEHGYEINNGIICFVCEGIKYVIPYMKNITNILEKNNFKHELSLMVPFSNGEYPNDEPIKEYWFYLRKEADKEMLQAV